MVIEQEGYRDKNIVRYSFEKSLERLLGYIEL